MNKCNWTQFNIFQPNLPIITFLSTSRCRIAIQTRTMPNFPSRSFRTIVLEKSLDRIETGVLQKAGSLHVAATNGSFFPTSALSNLHMRCRPFMPNRKAKPIASRQCVHALIPHDLQYHLIQPRFLPSSQQSMDTSLLVEAYLSGRSYFPRASR